MTPLLLSTFLLAGADPKPSSPPKGPSPTFAFGSLKGGEASLDITHSVPATESRIEQEVEGGKITEKAVQVTKSMYVTKQMTHPLDGVSFATAGWKKLDAEVKKRLAKGAIAALSSDGHPVGPKLLKHLKPDLQVMTVKRADSSTDPAALKPAPIPLPPPAIQKTSIGH
jgi:hypothetical protein